MLDKPAAILYNVIDVKISIACEYAGMLSCEVSRRGQEVCMEL